MYRVTVNCGLSAMRASDSYADVCAELPLQIKHPFCRNPACVSEAVRTRYKLESGHGRRIDRKGLRLGDACPYCDHALYWTAKYSAVSPPAVEEAERDVG